jgi:Pyruvate/2-oxoacid:ferredoxin oxidoreductase delta subunit
MLPRQKGQLYSEGPRAQHPHIDITYCIGCAACTTVCPEGDVLAMLVGNAAIVNGYECIGHSLCASRESKNWGQSRESLA